MNNSRIFLLIAFAGLLLGLTSCGDFGVDINPECTDRLEALHQAGPWHFGKVLASDTIEVVWSKKVDEEKTFSTLKTVSPDSTEVTIRIDNKDGYDFLVVTLDSTDNVWFEVDGELHPIKTNNQSDEYFGQLPYSNDLDKGDRCTKFTLLLK